MRGYCSASNLTPRAQLEFKCSQGHLGSKRTACTSASAKTHHERVPGSHHTCPLQGQDTSVLTDLLQISLVKLAWRMLFSTLERSKRTKCKAMALEGKGVVNPQNKGVVSPWGKLQFSGMKEPVFQRQARYRSGRGAPYSRMRVGRNLHPCTWGLLQAQPALLCMVICHLWLWRSSWHGPSP